MVQSNKKFKKGFTMVELMVVLAITAILAALVGGGLIGYIRLARFEKNEANARTLFQAAQIALTRMDTAGELDDFRAQVRDAGDVGTHFTDTTNHTQAELDELNSNIYALYYDKAADDTSNNQLVHDLLDEYIYDESLLDASVCIEIDAASGQVYSVFYDTNSDKLRFTDGTGQTNIIDRSYNHRRNDSLVGYYSAEDRVNVVELQQTKLKVKNPRLSNTETLTLSWDGDESRDTQVQYIAKAYSAVGTKLLFEIEIKLPGNKTEQITELQTKIYDKDGNAAEKNFWYPLSYNKGSFVLTLDAMASADLLRACENGKDTADTSLFSIIRLLPGNTEPQDFYITMQAQPREGYNDNYTASTEVKTNTENTLFAEKSTAKKAELKYYRHLYNTRWADENDWKVTGRATYTMTPQGFGVSVLNWTAGSVTVYCPNGEPNGKPVAKTPSAENPVAWPTIPKLSDRITLDGSNLTLANLQLRGTSVSATGKQEDGNLLDRYIGLVGENNGTLKNITLRDVDLQVNAEVVPVEQAADADTTLQLTDTTVLRALNDQNTEYRGGIRAVGALCGVNTGKLENCSLTHGLNNTLKSQVLAMLSFDNESTATTREQKNATVNNKNYTYYENEPRGIGGLVGVAMPKTGATATNLEVASNVTVAGLLQDTTLTATNNPTVDDQARYTAAAAEPSNTTTETVWRSVGVGGVFGTLDAAGLTTTDQTNADAAIKNAAAVTGNGFVGGIAGNIYNSTTAQATVTGLANTGTVSAGANYQGNTANGSRVLGQFFGGLAGYTQNVSLTGCTSSTRSDLTNTALTTQIQKGYGANGIIQESSPLKGDFVGGLIGFGKNITLTNCNVQKGYVLGRTFVGGIAGGFTGSNLEVTGGTNASYVFGNRYVGGIVSVNGAGSTISSMENTGLVAGLGQNAAYVGGIAGLNDATWGATGTATTTAATIKNCTNSMASDNATNSSRITLLKNLSTYMVSGKEETIYADFVGGLVGSNGRNAVLTWDSSAKTVSMGAVLYGKNYVGGVAGYNDATAQITNTKGDELTVTGQVIGEAVAQTGTDGTTVYVGGKAVGGMVGLNMAPNLPMVNVKTSLVHGELCVGGVIGANMPVASGANTFTVTSSKGTGTGNFATQTANGRVEADGLAGGIIGYNCLLSAPAQVTESILPSVNNNGGKLQIAVDDKLNYNTQGTVTFANFANQLNISANAYVGGIVGYNYGETKLIITNATNGTQSNAASTGRVSKYNNNGTLGEGVSLSAVKISDTSSFSLTQPNPSDSRSLADRAYFAGGIIGYAAQNTTLDDCKNYGVVTHESVAGGITGWNDGTITNSQTYSALGSQQNGYQYLGGIAGVNNGKINDSAMQTNATVRGSSLIGGVAGVNLPGATITYNNANSLNYSVQADYCAGGITGMNCGTVTLGDTQLNVNVQAGSYAGGIAGSNNTRGTNAATITGGKVGGAILASGNYAGGAAGANYASISGVQLVNGGYVRVNGQYAGGIAGNNEGSGTIENCSNTAAAIGNSYTVYATNGYAGGISGTNTAQASITGAQVSGNVKVGVALGDASGFTPINNGTITGGSIAKCEITATGESIGAVAAINNATGTIDSVELTGLVKFNSKATNVGGITGNNSGKVEDVTVGNGSLNLNGLTANADMVSLGGVVGTNAQNATVSNASVKLDVTEKLDKYVNLGGVVGSNSGTLNLCIYQGVLGTAETSNAGNITNGATNTGDTVGGIVGLNGGTVQNCTVASITLQVQGASALSDSQTTEQKLNSASHVGGIAGRNNGTVESSYVATMANGGSIITARFGFVGGIAGSNSGSITSSGAKGALTADSGIALVNQVNDWLDETNGDINAMVADMKNDGTGTYSALKGVDTVSDGGYGNVYNSSLSKNDLLVGLRGQTSASNKSGGYLGGIAGFNSVSGTMTNVATGKWFVYADNTTDDSKVGGMIGMNEATGELKTLVNCAAVRRFTRKDGTNDNDTTNPNNKNTAYVGGIIGVQQNANDDSWVISQCVNYGTVFDSGSNYIGGVIASWLKNGGTIEKSFNFGNLSTNTNSGNESGTIGGIVGFFDKPTPGGTANIISCQNHGDIKSLGIWEGTKKYGANDVAGILGKVLMAAGNDYLRVNIVDCVNGDVAMEAESLAAGIMGWLGPSSPTPDKVEIYIDRCRNYATRVNISPQYTESTIAGICGNRGNGTKTTASTTITNCFALYSKNGTTEYASGYSYKLAPIAMNRSGNENIVAKGNYFMDVEVSFNDSYNKAMKAMSQEVTNRTKQGFWGNSSSDSNCYGTRLIAGINNSMEDGTERFFAAGMMRGEGASGNVNDVDTQFCFINTPTDGSLREIRRYKNEWTNETRECAKILLWYKDKDGDGTPSKGDITDELIQNYYSTILNAGTPGNVTNLNVTHDNEGTSAYGRYEITWSAPTDDAIFTDNVMQKVKHYLVTLYKYDENNNLDAIDGYSNIVVYGTRYLFDADKTLADAIGNSAKFCVGVKAVNGAMTEGTETYYRDVTFLRPLPTPELEVRLEKKNTNGQPYGQYVVLKNASAYKNIECTIDVKLLQGSSVTLTATNPETALLQGLGQETNLRATAIPSGTATSKWMNSQTYDEKVGIPVTYFGSGNVNSGLVHGAAFELQNGQYTSKGQPVITGTTTDDLKITVTLSFTADRIAGVTPTYRVMLLGQYTRDDKTIGTVTTSKQSLQNQYVTLASVEKPVYSTDTEFVLDNLPDEAFDGTYTNLQVISVPVNAGYSQVVTRWDISEDEAAAAIGRSSATNPACWSEGLEIVRNTDGTFSYAHLTPLQFYATGDPWGSQDITKKQIRRDNLNLNILTAPVVSEEAKGEIRDADGANKLDYTFTWNQYTTANGTTPDITQHDYDITLYGYSVQPVKDENGETMKDDNGNDVTTKVKEKIELKDGVSLDSAEYVTFDSTTGTYTLKFCVDDVLANGSAGWRYNEVQLHVTRKPSATDTGTIGAAGSANCEVMQRLAAVSIVDGISQVEDNNADALHYTVTWSAGTGNVASYTLYAEQKNVDAWEYLCKWEGITETSYTVDLEQYQGKTLRFYVVAEGKEGDSFRSANGVSADAVIANRTAAPTVSSASLSHRTPSQEDFLNNETLTLTVGSGNAASYYYTGYLFKNKDDYQTIAGLANAYQTATDSAKKATALTELQTALNGMLTDTSNTDRVLRIIADDNKDGGEPTATSTTGSASISISSSFTMKPEYARRWLLPALRSMTPAGSSDAASNWYYYTADASTVAQNMQLPAIKLDAPKADNSRAEYTQEVNLYQNAPVDDGTPRDDKATLTLTRRTVEWPIGNLYTPDGGETRSLTNRYQFTVTPYNEGDVPYTVTVTVNNQAYTDDDGKEHPIGEILKVEKTVTLTLPNDGAQPETLTQVIPQTEAEGRVWYDLSLLPMEVQTTDDNNNVIGYSWSEVWTSRTTRLTGKLVSSDTTSYYAVDVVPMLEFVQGTDSNVLRLTLPELLNQPEGGSGELAKNTQTVTVKALPYKADNVEDDKTVASEGTPVTVNAPQTTTQEAADPQPVMAVYDTAEQAAPEVPVQAAPRPEMPVETAPVQMQTPETAAPAEPEQTEQPPAEQPAA